MTPPLYPLTPDQRTSLQARALARVYGERVPPSATASIESAGMATGRRESFWYAVVRQPRRPNVVYRVRVMPARGVPELRPLTRVPKALR